MVNVVWIVVNVWLETPQILRRKIRHVFQLYFWLPVAVDFEIVS